MKMMVNINQLMRKKVRNWYTVQTGKYGDGGKNVNLSFINPLIFAPHWPLWVKVIFTWIVLFLSCSLLSHCPHLIWVELFLLLCRPGAFLHMRPSDQGSTFVLSLWHLLSCAFSEISLLWVSAGAAPAAFWAQNKVN